MFAQNGKRIDRRDAQIDPNDATRVVVHVPTGLEQGVYTVEWRVISADSHVVRGAYRIGVGVAPAGDETAAESPFDPSSRLASALRWLSLVGAFLVGGAIFLLAALPDRLARDFRAREIARGYSVVGAAIVLAAWVPAVAVQAAAASGRLGGGIAEVLTATPWGAAFLVRAAAGLAVVAAAALAWSSARYVLLPATLILFATYSITGHAVAQSTFWGRAIAVALDFAHLAAAAVWIGGILVLVAILLQSLSGQANAAERFRALFAWFTPAAAACAGIVLATGIYGSSLHVASIAELVTSAYGLLLVAKVVAVAGLLLIARRHMRIGRGSAAAGPAMRSLSIEALAGLTVVALTAALVGQAPPAQRSAVPTSLASVVLAFACIVAVGRFALVALESKIRVPPRLSGVANAAVVFCASAFLAVGVAGSLVGISSVAMYPMLQKHDVVYVDRLTFELWPPRDGDIAVFRAPYADGADIAARVVGVGGDAVSVVHEPIAYDLTGTRSRRAAGQYRSCRPCDSQGRARRRRAAKNGVAVRAGDYKRCGYEDLVDGQARTARIRRVRIPCGHAKKCRDRQLGCLAILRRPHHCRLDGSGECRYAAFGYGHTAGRL